MRNPPTAHKTFEVIMIYIRSVHDPPVQANRNVSVERKPFVIICFSDDQPQGEGSRSNITLTTRIHDIHAAALDNRCRARYPVGNNRIVFGWSPAPARHPRGKIAHGPHCGVGDEVEVPRGDTRLNRQRRSPFGIVRVNCAIVGLSIAVSVKIERSADASRGRSRPELWPLQASLATNRAG